LLCSGFVFVFDLIKSAFKAYEAFKALLVILKHLIFIYGMIIV